jgi:hypothetical protein
VIVIPPLREKIAERLGKPVALSTVYRMLARNDWRKLAPNTAHPKGDAPVRKDWEKPQGRLNEIVSGGDDTRSLRRMFQDEARFGRISDTRYCGGRVTHSGMATKRHRLGWPIRFWRYGLTPEVRFQGCFSL